MLVETPLEHVEELLHDAAASFTPPPTSPIDFLSHDVDATPPLHAHTTSVNRSYSDLHQGAFLGYAFGLCALRTALQQPLNLALARKQTSAAASRLSTWSILSSIYAREGRLRGLSRGMWAMCLASALSEVIYLCLFEWGREWAPGESHVTRDAISGYVADAACRVVHIPLSVIAFRQMTSTGTSTPLPRRNAWQTLVAMYSERGLRTVFAGFGTTLVVGCQWTALWWAMYGKMKESMYRQARPYLQRCAHSPLPCLPACWTSPEDNLAINTLASVSTSVATAVLFNPYLVIRTNLQVTPGATLWSVTRQVYQTRGARGLYSGLILSIGACVVDGALASTSYEYAKLWSDRTRGG